MKTVFQTLIRSRVYIVDSYFNFSTCCPFAQSQSIATRCPSSPVTVAHPWDAISVPKVSLVSNPDQIFCARSAATLAKKVGHIMIFIGKTGICMLSRWSDSSRLFSTRPQSARENLAWVRDSLAGPDLTKKPHALTLLRPTNTRAVTLGTLVEGIKI